MKLVDAMVVYRGSQADLRDQRKDLFEKKKVVEEKKDKNYFDDVLNKHLSDEK